MRWIVLAALAVLCQSCARASLPPSTPQKRGNFAFYYAASYTPAEINWYGRFNIVVTGDFLPPEQVRELHAAGCKLIRYEWTVAYYLPNRTPAGGWERTLLRDHPDWLLNPTGPLYGGAGAADIPAYYYDSTSPGLQDWRVRHLVQEAREHHYDGTFFDTTGFSSVQSQAQEVFKQRHPGADYDAYVGGLLKRLKNAAPDLIIFTNQGYRHYQDYLPYADYDLSESYMTTTDGPQAQVFVEGKGLQTVTETHVHPWNDPAHPWDSVSFYCNELIDKPMREHGYRTRICHLNYGQPRYVPTGQFAEENGQRYPVFRPTLDREALYYGVAAALLMGQSSYYSPPSGIPADDVYFADLGRPLQTGYSYSAPLGVAYRFFQNGFVIVNGTDHLVNLNVDTHQPPARAAGVWDVFNNRRLPGFGTRGIVQVPASYYPATRRSAPSGRVFLYLRHTR